MTVAYLSLGSNLGDREANVRKALGLLDANPDIRVMKASSLYETAPIGVTDQNDFINAAALVETGLDPQTLLQQIHRVEHDMGRERNFHWGPRVIDMDLLLYDGVEMETPELTIPHPEMMKRAFVLVPLMEIAPDLELPGGLKPSEALGKLGDQGVRKLAEVA